MKFGLISDTHLPALGEHPPIEVERAFADVDMILHAGDIYNAACLDWLERIAPVVAVEVAPAPVVGDHRVAERRIVQVDGFAIGLVHDLGMIGIDEVLPGALATRFHGPSIAASAEQFFGGAVDAVVFGHTHYHMAETHDGILFVNPGSPTLPKQVRRLGTVAVMELSGAVREARIIELIEHRA